MGKSKKTRHFWVIVFKYMIGIAALLWLYCKNKIQIYTLVSINAKLIFAAFLLSFIQLYLSALRLQLLLGVKHITVSVSKCFLYNAIGIFYSTFLPGSVSGDVMRAYYFCNCDEIKAFSKSVLVGALITDRVHGTLSMLLVGIVMATLWSHAIGISNMYLLWLWFGFCGSIFFYILICRLHHLRWQFFEKLRLRFLINKVEFLLTTMDLTSYSYRTQLYSFFYSFLIHFISGLIIYLVAIQLKAQMSFSQVMVSTPLGLLANTLPISPGGLGVGEKGFEVLFELMGGRHGAAVFLISRIFLYAPSFLGAMAIIIFSFKRSSNSIVNGLKSKMLYLKYGESSQ